MKVAFNKKKQQEPNREKGIRIPYGSAKRAVSRWRWYLILFIVATPLIYLATKIIASHILVTGPGYVSFEKIIVNSKETGSVEQVHVLVGDQISPGETIISLYNPALIERREVVLAERQALDSMEKDRQPISVLSPESVLSLHEEQVAYNKSRLSDVQFLFDAGAATIAELNLARAQLRQAKANMMEAHRNYTGLQQSYQKDLRLLGTNFLDRKQRLDAQILAINNQMLRLEQVAPKNGRVLDVLVETGQAVSPGTPLVIMGQSEKPYALVYLSPRHARYARKGTPATVEMATGHKIKAVVREDAGLSRRLPSDLTSPISTRDVSVLVELDFSQPIPRENDIDGLPITVRFKLDWNLDMIRALF